jgi:hypothetical protein
MLLSLKDPTILKEVNDVDKWRKVKGIIEAQLKYVRRVWRVNLIVKYKAATAPIDASTNAKDADFTIAM